MQPLLVGIGELLWDIFPLGRRLGGAPANFAGHASRLGCRSALVSRVGADALGREALGRLDDLGVDRTHVQKDPALATGTVSVTLDSEGRPGFVIHEGSAWDALAPVAALWPLAAAADVVCFGTLASRDPRAAASIRRFLAAARSGCLRIFDVNLRQSYHSPDLIRSLMEHCDVLKVNADELPVVAAACGVSGDALQGLCDRYRLRLLALTLGADGSILCAGGQRLVRKGTPVAVVDTVGAGDAFTAALAAGLARGEDLATLHRRAEALSAYVCGQEGATPDTTDFLKEDPAFR